jgi:hypothetical protein
MTLSSSPRLCLKILFYTWVPMARLFMNVKFEFKSWPLGAVEKLWSVTELVLFVFTIFKLARVGWVGLSSIINLFWSFVTE